RLCPRPFASTHPPPTDPSPLSLHDALPISFRSDELHVARTYSDLSKRRFKNIPYGGNRFDLEDDLKCEAWKNHSSGSGDVMGRRSEEHTSELQSRFDLVCRLLLEKKKTNET